jgi:hypothetical protein
VAIDVINDVNKSDGAFIYCGRTQYVTEKLKLLGQSPLFFFPTSFRNSLVQSIAGGNTMVFNQTLRELFILPSSFDIPSHDWWAYMVASSTGGKVIYDPNSSILYRQHNKALVGGNQGLSPKLNRIKNLANSKFRLWTDQNIQGLNFIKKNMKPESIKIFEDLKHIRNVNLLNKIKNIYKLKIHRQSKIETLLIKLAILLNKV